MKITITVDATPDEVRQALGLPVLNEVHEALLSKMSDHVQNGSLDPEKMMELLTPSMKAGQQIMETILNTMSTAMNSATSKTSGSSSKSSS